jgi:hypothetical protein
VGRETSFIEGFIKQANFALRAWNKVKKPLAIGAMAGGASYGVGKVIQGTEDPEQARLRQLRKQKALPYQQGVE